ncbi:uncharacterized protein METZ01_LOCUS193535, partial [marine metagenome]
MPTTENQNQNHYDYLMKGFRYALTVCGPALIALLAWGLLSPPT